MLLVAAFIAPMMIQSGRRPLALSLISHGVQVASYHAANCSLGAIGAGSVPGRQNPHAPRWYMSQVPIGGGRWRLSPLRADLMADI
jgi:hypothetical protein